MFTTDWVLDLTAGKAAGNLLKSGETLTEAYANVSKHSNRAMTHLSVVYAVLMLII
jgi:hypothetical protein